MNAIEFCRETVIRLATLKGEAFGVYWVARRREFHRTFTSGLVFSTRLGLFFEEVLNRFETGELLKADKGVLSDYDKNFNTWLTNVRKNVNYRP
jgi:hypothetical protein